jgi:hypothetical protein
MGHEMRDDGGREATLDAAVRVTRIATDRFRLFVFLLLYNTHRKEKNKMYAAAAAVEQFLLLCVVLCVYSLFRSNPRWGSYII